MSLFDIIHNFFSDYIFYDETQYTNLLNVKVLTDVFGSDVLFRDWLSSICTIAVLIWLVICCFLFVRWIFRLFAGLLKG